jgi:hypothetical protein
MVDDGQTFAIDMLERFGELLPFAFTANSDGKHGMFSAYHHEPMTGNEFLAQLYDGLRIAALRGEIENAAIFTEGEMDGGDALVCFAERRGAEGAVVFAPFRYVAKPWKLLNTTVRRGKIALSAPMIKKTERRLFVS